VLIDSSGFTLPPSEACPPCCAWNGTEIFHPPMFEPGIKPGLLDIVSAPCVPVIPSVVANPTPSTMPFND
jgi:hypothetical protein